MVTLSALLLPILLAGVAVFFVSFLLWMVSPHHRSDWKAVPDEDRLMAELRELGGVPASGGQFAFPHCSSPEQYKDPAWLAKYEAGPKGFLVLKPAGPDSLPKNLVVSLTFNLVTTLLVAYVATMALPAGAASGLVFRFVWTVAFLANSTGIVWAAIWAGKSWSSTFKELADGLCYGAATAAVFAFLWPGA